MKIYNKTRKIFLCFLRLVANFISILHFCFLKATLVVHMLRKQGCDKIKELALIVNQSALSICLLLKFTFLM